MTSQVGQPAPWPRVSVVMPTLNDGCSLPYVFARIPPEVHEVIVADARSLDDTLDVARRLRPDVRIVSRARGGKGNALASGFAAATGDVIVMANADGTVDPAEIPQLIKALLTGADYAKGTRYAPGTDNTLSQGLGSSMLTTLVNVCFGTRYSDLCFGFNAFWRRHVSVLRLDEAPLAPAGEDGLFHADCFEAEALINIRAAEAGLVIAEVPSFQHTRIDDLKRQGTVRDGWRLLHLILRERFGTSVPRSTKQVPAIPSQRVAVEIGRESAGT